MSSNILKSLTAAAFALPGIADAQETKNIEVGFKHHSYKEDNLPSQRVVGTQERYDINVNQFQVNAQISDSLSAALNYQSESMSGASPWYTIKNGDGEVVQVMSGASIKDDRQDVSVNLGLRQENKTYGVVVARSEEDDYESLSFGASVEFESEDKLNTWAISADVSNDDLFPVDTSLFLTRPLSGSKRSTSLLLSYSRILSKVAMAQVSLGYIDRSGYLADPYKVVFVENEIQADSRPDSRIAKTLSAKLRYFVEPANAALHFDYRYFNDDWQINSHTIDMAWYQNIGFGIQLIPSVRLYNQTSSYFYEHFYDNTRADGFYSTDYRLSEYGAITYGLKIEKKFDDWRINLQAEEYMSEGDLGLADAKDENPALLDFSLISFGVTYSF